MARALFLRELVIRAQLHQGLAQQAAARQVGQSLQLGEILVRLGNLGRAQLNQAILDWPQYDHEYR